MKLSRTFWLLVCLLGLSFVVCYKKEKRFSVSDITLSLPAAEKSSSPVEMGYFDKPFYYLGSGSQMVVFVNEEQKVVLKFFKRDHLEPKKTLVHLPLPSFLENYRYRKTIRRDENREALFSSLKLAFASFKEESGLLFLHLEKTADWKKKVKLVDKWGKKHWVDLDTTAFVLQKRAEKIYDHWSPYLQEKRWQALQEEIQQLAFLIETRMRKGLKDTDGGISQNFGFIDGRPVQIDVGDLCFDPQAQNDAEIAKEKARVLQKIDTWIKGKCS